MKKANSNQGFTLIELMIALAVGSLVMLSVYSLFSMQVKISTVQEQTSQVQQNIRSAMYIMENELRMAGYAGRNAAGVANVGITAATATSVSFSFVAEDDGINNDGDGDTDEIGEVSTIVYAMYDSDGDGDADDIGRTVDGGAVFPTAEIAENIEQIEFYYTLADNSQTTAPADPSLIRSVQLTMLARSRKPFRDRITSRVYNTPGGAAWVDNDGFFRRYVTTNIIFRNM